MIRQAGILVHSVCCKLVVGELYHVEASRRGLSVTEGTGSTPAPRYELVSRSSKRPSERSEGFFRKWPPIERVAEWTSEGVGDRNGNPPSPPQGTFSLGVEFTLGKGLAFTVCYSGFRKDLWRASLTRRGERLSLRGAMRQGFCAQGARGRLTGGCCWV